MKWLKEHIILVSFLLLLLFGFGLELVRNVRQSTPQLNSANATFTQFDDHELIQVDQPLEQEEQVNSEIAVDVKGAVESPGVYIVSPHTRIKDVIQQAGGFNQEADQDQINLAEKVYDEMVIYVPYFTEQNNSVSHYMSNHDKIKVNLATQAELETLPGIGATKAQAMIEYREANGLFNTIDDLEKVNGIGKKTVEQLSEHVVVP